MLDLYPRSPLPSSPNPTTTTFIHTSAISSNTPQTFKTSPQNKSTSSKIPRNKTPPQSCLPSPFQLQLNEAATKKAGVRIRNPRRSTSKKILLNYLTRKKAGDLCECQKHPAYITIGHHKPLPCQKCRGCKSRRDCGFCPMCRDMEKFCGPGLMRGTSCEKRKCRKPRINCHPCSRGDCRRCMKCPCNTLFTQNYH